MIQKHPPVLILITGLPCAGKTRIAGALSDAFNLPLIAKDIIKERLFDSIGWHDRAWSRKLSHASFDILKDMTSALLKTNISCLIEGNFSPKNHSPGFQNLHRLYPHSLIQILCYAKADVLIARFEARIAQKTRHPGHLDELLLDELRPELRQGKSGFLKLDGPKLEVDTSDEKNINLTQVRDTIRQYLIMETK
ncbi:hypothetical protein JW960_28275 [candidate division KSB1 bacterium]|nr:hypothetical protein [candidate division KSB1 bacterium]